MYGAQGVSSLAGTWLGHARDMRSLAVPSGVSPSHCSSRASRASSGSCVAEEQELAAKQTAAMIMRLTARVGTMVNVASPCERLRVRRRDGAKWPRGEPPAVAGGPSFTLRQPGGQDKHPFSPAGRSHGDPRPFQGAARSKGRAFTELLTAQNAPHRHRDVPIR